MAATIIVVCDKCHDSKTYDANNMLFQRSLVFKINREWDSSDELILCKQCAKEWDKLRKDTKQKNKKAFIE